MTESYITSLMAARKETAAHGRPVVAYLKPSDYCNVGCDHCYLPLAVRANKARMDWTTLDSAIAAVATMIERQRAPGALILWHGGEPLALPIDYFTEACDRVRAALPEAPQAIQTSLIPYRSEWADALHAYCDGQVGSSIDFSQRTIRGDATRYLDLWMRKVEAARADGLSVVPGMVPSRGELGRGGEIVDWFVAHGFSAFNIDRYNNYGWDDPARPINREHSAFLTEVFDRAMAHAREGRFIAINTVQAALGGVLHNQPGDRWGGSCSHDFLVVNPDGSAGACPDKISFENFGNIRDGFDAIAASDKRREWIRYHLAAHRNSDCPTCPFNTFCRSGCPLTPNDPASEGECSGYQRHLLHVRNACAAEPDLVAAYLEGVRA